MINIGILNGDKRDRPPPGKRPIIGDIVIAMTSDNEAPLVAFL